MSVKKTYDFAPVNSWMESYVNKGHFLGSSILVALENNIIHEYFCGFRNKANTKPSSDEGNLSKLKETDKVKSEVSAKAKEPKAKESKAKEPKAKEPKAKEPKSSKNKKTEIQSSKEDENND